MASGLMVITLLLAMAAYSSASTWCVCKQGSDAVLQKTLDYACGNGADCNTIHPKGACYNPDTVKDHCNFAVNSYFQKKGQAQGSCDFLGTASITTTDPSSSGCVYPSSASGSTTSPGMTSPSTITPPSSTNTPSYSTNRPPSSFGTPGTSTSTPMGNNPDLTSPTGGLGPAGGINTDVSDAAFVQLGRINFVCFLIAFLALGFMF